MSVFPDWRFERAPLAADRRAVRCLMNAHVFQSTLTVREATKADVAALVDLMQEFYEESAFALDREWAAATFHRLLASPEQGKIWIALADQVPVGHAVLSLASPNQE